TRSFTNKPPGGKRVYTQERVTVSREWERRAGGRGVETRDQDGQPRQEEADGHQGVTTPRVVVAESCFLARLRTPTSHHRAPAQAAGGSRAHPPFDRPHRRDGARSPFERTPPSARPPASRETGRRLQTRRATRC